MSRIFLSVILVPVLLLAGCRSTSNEVVVYTSVDQIFSEPVLKEFEKETGIKVNAVYDTEETKSTGVLNRLIAEKEHPQCDVFWSGDPVRTLVLKNRGITTPYRSPEAKDIPAVYKDPEGHWTGFSARARVLIYNKNLLRAGQVPQSVFDLTDSSLKDRVTLANPLFGTTTFHMAALFSVLGDEKAKALLTALKENGLVIATSNGDVRKRVVQGASACGITDTDDAFEAMKEGAPVDIVFLDQQGIGTLIIPNTVNLIKGSPHPENGKKLIDYLLSRRTEAALARSCAQMPLHKGVEVPAGVPSLDNIVPMKIDYDQTAQKLEEIQNYLKEWVKGP
jgi:iron(III) transport system substrate-binding protein